VEIIGEIGLTIGVTSASICAGTKGEWHVGLSSQHRRCACVKCEWQSACSNAGGITKHHHFRADKSRALFLKQSAYVR